MTHAGVEPSGRRAGVEHEEQDSKGQQANSEQQEAPRAARGPHVHSNPARPATRRLQALHCGAIPIIFQVAGLPDYAGLYGDFPHVNASKRGWQQQVERIMRNDSYYRELLHAPESSCSCRRPRTRARGRSDNRPNTRIARARGLALPLGSIWSQPLTQIESRTRDSTAGACRVVSAWLAVLAELPPRRGPPRGAPLVPLRLVGRRHAASGARACGDVAALCLLRRRGAAHCKNGARAASQPRQAPPLTPPRHSPTHCSQARCRIHWC